MNELFYKELKHTKHVALAEEDLLVIRHEQVGLQKVLRVKGEAEQRAKCKILEQVIQLEKAQRQTAR
jgi:hypothetical protein